MNPTENSNVKAKERFIENKLGKVYYDENDVMIFPRGIPGFEILHRFIVYKSKETEPIKWLVSVEDKNCVLPLIEPFLVRIDYKADISEGDILDLNLTRKSNVEIYCVLVIPEEAERTTINLVAPIVVNLDEKIGKQVILTTDEYGVKHMVSDEIKRSEELIAKRAKQRSEGEPKSAGFDQKNK
ncbi:MAG: flagellar assembly protein FliW [Thermotoga sp.]|nr:flagellar assembly protein FliW [Thermotogota bacterium]RKX55362.1 MAG: flagellar assembly protein FliW [Thermotoga sp.]